MSLKFLIWTAILATALFFPISNLIYVLSVRRFERKAERSLDQSELDGQRRRARVLAIIVAAVFALLFNLNVFGLQ